MPQRSNDFQRLVTFLESQLAVDGATVTESAMLIDPVTGSKREVDVLIEFQAGMRSFRIGVECRDHKRRPDQRWVEEIYGKHSKLSIDRTVLVSRSGFTRHAKLLASHYRMEALTIAEALNTQWSEMIAGGTISLRLYRGVSIRGIRVSLHGLNAPAYRSLKDHSFQIESDGGIDFESFESLASALFTGKDFHDTMYDMLAQRIGDDVVIDLQLVPRAKTYLVDSDGLKLLVDYMMFEAAPRFDIVEMRLIPASYGQTDFAYGYGTIGGFPIGVYFTKTDAEDMYNIHLHVPQELSQQLDKDDFRMAFRYAIEDQLFTLP